MGNTNTRTRTRTTARRIAAFLGLLGALVMSSGIALMATATTASATPNHHLKDWVCKYVGTPGVDERLKNGNDGLVWVSTSATQGQYFNDAHGRSFVLLKDAPRDPKPDASQCPEPENAHASADVEWTEPTCENGNEADYVTNGAHVTWSVLSGSASAGGSIQLKATAVASYEFEGGDAHVRLFSHDFDQAEDCTAYDATAAVAVTQPDCDNENSPAFEPSGNHVTWEVTDQDLTPGGFVEVTFTADADHGFADHTTVKVITKDFGAAEEGCVVVSPPREVTPSAPTFTDPTCDTDPGVTLPQQEIVLDELARQASGPVVGTSDVQGIHYVATGDLVAGGTVEVDATLNDPQGTVFAEDAVTHWSHTFPTPQGCTVVSPPVVTPPTSTTQGTTHAVVTPTVVEAGLAGTVASDPRTQQGLALVIAGSVLLLGAGGLGRVRQRV